MKEGETIFVKAIVEKVFDKEPKYKLRIHDQTVEVPTEFLDENAKNILDKVVEIFHKTR